MNDSDDLSRGEETGRGGVRAWMKTLFGTKENTLKEALEEIISEHEEDGNELSSDERDMLRNVLEVGDLTVSDVMVPRADIVAADYKGGLEVLKNAFVEHGHTRLPIFEETLDRLRGFLHLKDIVPALAGDEPFEIDRLLRTLIYVSPTMKVVDLLVRMRLDGEHIAIVVDEYGGTDGLVTLEDLFEEIVGDIQDEHDEPEESEELKRLSPKVFEADGRVRIETLEKELGFSLRKEDEESSYDTLGGLIFDRLGRVPMRGEIVTIEKLARLDILDADPRRVRRVRLSLLQEPAADGASDAAPQ